MPSGLRAGKEPLFIYYTRALAWQISRSHSKARRGKAAEEFRFPQHGHVREPLANVIVQSYTLGILVWYTWTMRTGPPMGSAWGSYYCVVMSGYLLLKGHAIGTSKQKKCE